MKVRLAGLVGVSLLFTGCYCNSSLTEPDYRCSKYGIVEVRAPLEKKWKPVSGAAIIRCEPGKPITPDNLR